MRPLSTAPAETKLAHELVERGKDRVAFLEARAAIIHSLRVYNTNRLANAGTDERTVATVEPLLCFMGWEGRTQELSQLLSAESVSSGESQLADAMRETETDDEIAELAKDEIFDKAFLECALDSDKVKEIILAALRQKPAAKEATK